ncbi:hypothetical protein LOTGIDRAFT_192458 [Lottia gigantea]|uniref:MORN repeat-containing protein 1 n=1 Tax=Lottia gigantea TaxID=225164 RepID=V4A4N2_LOTGI|nr:hypothetical protein LOTGIDRAFT_192458 [Lottia gigantea]ESO89935.1 hypothetical protein LOTGIDRAFT_192458 [Lottia gigantea]
MDTSAQTKERTYIGEVRNLKREGFGVYNYENHFFKYEGEWHNGKKHGQGRLVMKDGSYVEGQFKNGEIDGDGFKYFVTSGAKYSGQFQKGELHGHGVMQYKDGSQFDGQWVFNKRQGHGTLKTSEKAVYEGAFFGNMRHGEGTQTYENGDWYRGGWVLDKREGYGEFRGADGTIYSGHWKSDQYEGDGRIEHCSGFIYEGEWFNGFPTSMATKITILVETNELEINHGDNFSVKVECRNEKGEVIEKDTGRELQLMAGFKYTKPQPGSSLFDMIEDVADKPIETPFGYDVVPFPLTYYSSNIDNPENEMKTGSKPSTPNDPNSKDTDDINDQIEWKPLPQPESKRSFEGCCEWNEVTLAPPPPFYSAFKGDIPNQPKNVKPGSRKAKAAIPPKGPKNEEYVIIVQDVTTPSFMEKSLEPAFLLLKVKRKKYIPKREPKPKWDTSKLIASMSKNTGEEEDG